MRKIIFLRLFITLGLLISGMGSSLNNPLWAQGVDSSILASGNKRMALELDAEAFFYDAEYSTPLAKGYTVTGFRFSPTLTYGINERTQLRMGLNTILFAGLDSIYLIRPALSLVYAPTDWVQFIAGTIFGATNHHLDAPLYDPSHQYLHYPEEGLQIVTTTNRWNSDTWLDWSHYLTPWTPDQERFTVGTNHNINLLQISHSSNSSDKSFHVDIPLLFLAAHRGGEVKTIDTNTVTTFNEKTGLRFVYHSSNSVKPLSHTITLSLPFYLYHLQHSTLDHSGKAFYPSLSYLCLIKGKPHNANNSDTKLRATVGYWYGDHFFSDRGNPSFWSANTYTRLHIPHTSGLATAPDIRNMMTLSASIEHNFKGLDIGLCIDAYMDIDMKENDYFFGFFMRINERIMKS